LFQQAWTRACAERCRWLWRCSWPAVRPPGARAPNNQETKKTPREEIGEASFYAGRHHGKETASGEPFDQNALTAAHKSLPFGSRIEITNLENDRSVVVRVNDRGPFADGRIVDVSLAAAKALGMKEDGVVRVRLQQVP
jgi:rare lipoprotein A